MHVRLLEKVCDCNYLREEPGRASSWALRAWMATELVEKRSGVETAQPAHRKARAPGSHPALACVQDLGLVPLVTGCRV